MDFGKTLKSSRESKDLTLQQIARELKININVLKKIELSEANELPNPTSTKGFIKSYAAHLGIDSKPLIDDYLSKIEVKNKSLEETVFKGAVDSRPFFLSEFIQKKVLPVFILAVFIGLGFVAFKYLNGADKFVNTVIKTDQELKKSKEVIGKDNDFLVANEKVSVENNEENEEVDEIKKNKDMTSSKKSVTDSSKAPIKQHKLIIEPLDKTYAYYKSEKNDKFITLALKPNVRRTFAFKTAEIKFLDAGAISLIFNGKDLGSPGIFAEEKTIKFPSLEGL